MLLEKLNEIFDNDIPIILKNYVLLKDKLDINELKELKKIFDSLSSNEIKSINIIYENLINDAVIMVPKEKEDLMIVDDEIINQTLNSVGNIINIEDGYFYKILASLIRNLNYITYEEQLILNFLLEELKIDDRKIEEINNDKTFIIKVNNG